MQSSGKKQKKESKSSVGHIFKALFILLILCFAVFFIAGHFHNFSPESITEWFENTFSNAGRGEGFPYTINASSVVDMKSYNSDVAVLTDTSFIVLNSSAKEVTNLQHNYTKPVMDIAGGRAIIYDRGSKNMMIVNRSKVMYQKKYDQSIYTCAIGKKGNFAVATSSNEATSELTVYSYGFKEIFKWRSSEYHITRMALSDDGKSIAVVTVGAKDGAIKSSLNIFDFNKTKATSVFEYPDTMLVSLDFNDNSVVAAGDNLISVIKDESKRLGDIDYGTQSLFRYSVSKDGSFAAYMTKYGNSNSGNLNVYDAAGQKKFSASVDETVRDVNWNGDNAAVLLNNKTIVYNDKGEKTKTIKTGNDTSRLIVIGTKVYVLGFSEIKAYSIK